MARKIPERTSVTVAEAMRALAPWTSKCWGHRGSHQGLEVCQSKIRNWEGFHQHPKQTHLLLVEDIERVPGCAQYRNAECDNQTSDDCLSEVERCWVDLHIDFYDDILSRAR